MVMKKSTVLEIALPNLTEFAHQTRSRDNLCLNVVNPA